MRYFGPGRATSAPPRPAHTRPGGGLLVATASRPHKSACIAAGNPAGRTRGSRNKLSEAVICALLRDFSRHEEKAIAKVRREQPGVWLKVIAMLVPREHKVQHSNPLKDLTDEQLEAMIEYIETSLAAQAGRSVKLIEGTIEPTALEATAPPALEPPEPKSRLMLAADAAVPPSRYSERLPWLDRDLLEANEGNIREQGQGAFRVK